MACAFCTLGHIGLRNDAFRYWVEVKLVPGAVICYNQDEYEKEAKWYRDS